MKVRATLAAGVAGLLCAAGSTPCHGAGTLVEAFSYDWNHDGIEDHFSLEATRAPRKNSLSDFNRLRIDLSGRGRFEFDSPDGWIRFGDEPMVKGGPLVRDNRTASARVSLLSATTTVKRPEWLFLLGDNSGPNDPFTMTVITLDASAIPRIRMSEVVMGFVAFLDLEGDGVPELIGVPCMSEVSGAYETYKPYIVRKLTRRGSLKVDLALSEQYSRTHYAGWIGPYCTSSFLVESQPPPGRKPKLFSVSGTPFAIPPLNLKTDSPVVMGVLGIDHELNENVTSERIGFARLKSALQPVAKCLAGRGVRVDTEFTKRVEVTGGNGEGIDFGQDETHFLGVILARPDAPPRVIYSTGDQRAFRRELAKAAGDYFNALECTR